VFGASDATEFGINVRCSPDHQEYTRIAYDMTQSQIVLDYAQSSLTPVVQRDVRAVPFKWADDESLTLHIFLDRSIIEVFVNNQLCLTSRVYPVRDDSLGVELYAQGGA
jgi:beta-fructofuranosidase